MTDWVYMPWVTPSANPVRFVVRSPPPSCCQSRLGNRIVRESSMKGRLLLLLWAWAAATWVSVSAVTRLGRGVAGEQPLSRIAVERVVLAVNDAAYVKASPLVLGHKGENSEWADVEFFHPNPSDDDWIGVFSPANFSDAICEAENTGTPVLCTAPIKYQFANFENDGYNKTGKGYLKLQLINQREDFSFALFSGGLSKPKLISVSNKVAFANPKAPVYPRLAQGKSWNEMTVTWTSGYDITEAVPFVEWGEKGGRRLLAPAGTLTFDRNSMCGSPARTVGWRHPGYIHTSFLKDLWPDSPYTYRLGHRLMNGTRVWSKSYSFKASPYPGQDSLQRVVVFGDMGKAEADGSNEFSDFQPGSLNTTYQIIRDLEDIDMVVHIGDICYADGYLSQWDQFTAQIEPIASRVPYMIGLYSTPLCSSHVHAHRRLR
uniref:Purple acid phosphatase n=1 Tax=Zea mays TaxID=4577 RepID=A0A804MQX2_MAIZE